MDVCGHEELGRNVQVVQDTVLERRQKARSKEVHSLNMDLLQPSQNPEVEVHPVVESINDDTLDNRTKVFPFRRKQVSNDISDSEKSALPKDVDIRIGETNCEQEDDAFELEAQFTWSDDDHSENGVLGFNLIDSIAAIRKEASKLDAVLAVDQLESLKAENRNVRRELQDRNEEVEELQTLVQLKDDRIGTLELERDLYKADTNKLANDLENCLVKLRKVGGEQPYLPAKETDHGFQGSIRDIKAVGSTSPSSVLELPKLSAAMGDNNGLRRKLSKNRLDPPSCGSTSHTSMTASVTSKSVLTRRVVPVLEKPRITAAVTTKQGAEVPARARTKVRTPSANVPQTPLASPDQKSNELNRSAFLQGHVQEISERLMTALDTSDELRRRLAILNRYSEKTVNDLQLSLKDAKAERFQLEFDLTRYISALERENDRLRAQAESGHVEETPNSARENHRVTFDV